jgi:hypothetical protein
MHSRRTGPLVGRLPLRHPNCQKLSGTFSASICYAERVIDDDARVLVCLLNEPADLERVRWDHWYRIPLRSAPDEVLPEVLAFYLTANFGDERWAIHEYAEVRGHELVRRIDLFPEQPEHPRAQMLYYKIQLGPLQRLTRPVPSLRWRRFVVLQTTGERLLNALELSDLVERSERRFIRLMDADDGRIADSDE